MKNGDFTTHIAPFGYSYKSKTLVPNPNEVPIIEFIFNSYLSGKSLSEIAKELTQNEKPITSEKHSEWNRTSIQYILTNEKYVGDSLVQKRFTPDELPLKKIRNVGQLPRYYIRNSHPAIISREIFEAVQVLLQQKTISKSTVSSYPLSQIVKCGHADQHSLAVFRKESFGGPATNTYRTKTSVPWVSCKNMKFIKAF